MSTTLLREAIRRGLRSYGVAGASAALGLAALPVAAQNASNTADQKSQNLDTIVVTGSNIRRVDTETSNPIVTIDHAQIQKSGKLTLGDLVQDLPSIAGAVMNPNINNGGGTGASAVSLRGLGSTRTLLLIDGHRIPSFMQNLNLIPVNAVERIEVLSDGASAVYGSDAVAGVVNIITRTNYQGAEFSANYGISDHDDGERKGYNFTFGQTTDKGSIMAGVNYNKQDPVSAANRKYSKDALYLYAGQVQARGSSHTPNGRIVLPDSLNTGSNFGCSSPNGSTFQATKLPGATGTSLTDYRCYNGQTDAFNFQAVGNYDLIPSDRIGVFFSGTYKLTDNIETYLQVIHNKTNANSQLAPEIFNAQQFQLTISKNSYYNPFGVDFGPGAFDFRGRLTGVGDRHTDNGTTVDQANTGFKINFGDSGWSGNVNLTYAHMLQNRTFKHFVELGSLLTALGPSFKDSTGAIVCGTPDAVIAGCTPLNIFDVNSASNAAILNQFAGDTSLKQLYQMKEADANINGSLFELPAGAMSLAAGVSDRKEHQDTSVATVSIADINGSCAVPSTCSGPTEGGFTVKEAYAELFVPLLKDMPFANSLNIDVGDRYSKYSNFGSTSNWKVALEYKPIADLLLRATVSKVFRAPQITDIFAGAAISAPPFADPCTTLQPGQTNPACQFVVVTPGHPFISQNTSQTNAVASGSQYAGFNLTPEFGKSFDFGFVYDPHWVEGLSLNSDIYRIYLNNLIQNPAVVDVAQIVADSCFAGQLQFCPLIHRFPSGPSQGQINTLSTPVINGGRLDTKGADFAVHYRLPETGFGNFRANFQATYIAQYQVFSGSATQNVAGHYDKNYGNFSRWRALTSLDWNLGPWNATWSTRFINKMTIGYVNADLGRSADASGCYGNNEGCTSVIHFGSYVYHNISAGYNIEPINTLVQVGIDNVTDKQPPSIYLENNANPTDGSTYNTVGRFFFANVTVKF